MNNRSVFEVLILLFGFAGGAFFSPANATLFDLTYPEQDIVRAVLSEIDVVDERVYTVRFDENGAAEIVFGDGVQGSRPSSGGSVVASYQFGAGADGKIINEYEITETNFPVIPITDFWPTGSKQSGASLIIVGLTSISFDFSPDGLRVTDAELAIAPVPVPAAVWLFGTALLALFGFGRSKAV